MDVYGHYFSDCWYLHLGQYIQYIYIYSSIYIYILNYIYQNHMINMHSYHGLFDSLRPLLGFLIHFRALAWTMCTTKPGPKVRRSKRSQAVQMVAKEEVEVAFLHLNQRHGLFQNYRNSPQP